MPEFQLVSEHASCSVSGWAPGNLLSGTMDTEEADEGEDIIVHNLHLLGLVFCTPVPYMF
jgi:hypothetical protein